MADVVRPEIRSRMMSGIRGKDTKPELQLRRGLFARGVRFRLHVKSLPGRPDIVIPKFRSAIFIHGCFWHAHDGCRFFKLPEGNRSFWAEKLGRNRQRDAASTRALLEAGWRVSVIWECAIKASASSVLDALQEFLSGDRQTMEILTTQASGRLEVRIADGLTFIQ